MNKVYLRFSNDIYADIERGYSFFFRTKEKMQGLCAWSIPVDLVNGSFFDFNGNAISEEDIVSIAKELINNTYGSYSDNSEFHLITGDYVGSGNDGVLLKNVKLIESFFI